MLPALGATMTMPTRYLSCRTKGFYKNLHVVGPQAQLATTHVDDAGVAGPEHADFATFAKTDLLEAMGGIAGSK